VTDPTLDAARAIFEESLEGLRGAIAGASPDTLNARPAGDDTNPIAVLAVHAMHSTRMWFSIATGQGQPERDRPAEFVVRAEDADALLATVEGLADVAGQLGLIATGGTDYHGDLGSYAEAHATLWVPDEVGPPVRTALQVTDEPRIGG